MELSGDILVVKMQASHESVSLLESVTFRDKIRKSQTSVSKKCQPQIDIVDGSDNLKETNSSHLPKVKRKDRRTKYYS
jgi:hypothetical protein